MRRGPISAARMRYYELFKGGGFTVRVDSPLVILCSHAAEDCPQGRIVFPVTVTVSDGKRREKVTATSYCGR
jgi:hypothetical protein